MSCDPRGSTWRTRHSIEMGASSTVGAATTAPRPGVRPISANLSQSRPERTPHQSVARASSSVVRLMTNSPVRRMMSYEWRSRRIDT